MRMLLKRSLALLVSIVLVFSLFLSVFPQQARAQDTIKIVGNWQDAGNWNFDSSNIVLSETSTPGLYYGEYTFKTGGSYEFKAVINGSIWCTGAPKVADNNTNIPLNVTDGQTVKFWFFKNSQLVIDSTHFPNGPDCLVGQNSFKFVGVNNEWNPNDGKYQFIRVPDATYTYLYDNSYNDFSIPYGFKIIISGFGNLSWAWNGAKEGSVVKFKEGGDNIDLKEFKESNDNLLKTKFFLDILNGWLFTEKDLTNIQPVDFANNGSVIGGTSVHLTWAPYTPNANPLSAKLYYKIIDVSNDSELVSLTDYSTIHKIDIPREWIGKTIKIIANAKIGEITGPNVEFTLNIVDLPQDLIVEAANYITYNSIDETFLNLAQGDTVQNITSNFAVVTSYVYNVVYEGNSYPLTFNIDWESSNSSVLTINGSIVVVTRPTQGDLHVELRARARFGAISADGQKIFTLTVKKFLLWIDSGIPVTFNVTVPDYTPDNDNIYIAGDFKTDKLPKWDPAGIKLIKVGDKKYSITMYLPPNVTIEYKYTRGSWSKVEKDAFGNEISNRVLQINNQAVTKNDVVEAFADLGAVKQGLPTVNLVINVPQQTVIDTGDGGRVIKAEGGAISVPNTKNTVLIDIRSALNAIIKGENYTVAVKSSQQTYPLVSIEKQAVEGLKQKGAKNIEVKYSDTSVFVDIYNSAPSDIQVQVFQVPKEKIKIEESKLLTGVDDYTNIKILNMRDFKIVREGEVDKSNNAIYVFKLSSPIDDGVVPITFNDNGITPIKDFYIEGEYVIVKGKGSQTIGFAKIEKNFSDVDSIENSVATLVSLGIVQGDNENCLNLDKFITRAELAALFGRTFDLSQKYYRGYFADISKYNWYAPYVEALKENGILDGYNNKFNPNGLVTREQLSKIAVNIAEKYVSETLQKKAIADLEKASGWAKEYIQKALAYKVMDVDDQGNFRPQDYATRNEVFTTLYNLIVLRNKDLKNYITSDLKPLGVEVTFKVKVPQNTPDDNIHIAGTFSSIGYSDWNPSDNNLKLLKNADGTYSITMYIPEGTTIEYKYVRGEWSKVEKGPNGEELSNRNVTIRKGADNKMLIEDIVSRWADK
jgi:phospholipase/lecithinase/hemolysin